MQLIKDTYSTVRQGSIEQRGRCPDLSSFPRGKVPCAGSGASRGDFRRRDIGCWAGRSARGRLCHRSKTCQAVPQYIQNWDHTATSKNLQEDS